MEQAILLLHLAIVIFLIALVLLQRSEGGALGMGGGGGGVVTGRGAATALSKVTWYLAAAFLATSLTLTVMAQTDRQSGSVLDGLEVPAGGEGSNTGNDAGISDALTMPNLGDDDAPAIPAAPATGGDDAPATPPAN